MGDSILERMIPELQLMVYDLLQYQDVIRLSQTNRYFFAALGLESWPTSDKIEFIVKAQKWPKHNAFNQDMSVTDCLSGASDGYACFDCFRIRPRTEFSNRQTRNLGGKTHPDADTLWIRHCLDCGISEGVYGPWTVIRPAKMDVFVHETHEIAGQNVRTLENASPQYSERILCYRCHSFRDISAIHSPAESKPYCCLKCLGELPNKSYKRKEIHYRGLYPNYGFCPDCYLTFNKPVAVPCVLCDNSICASCYAPFDSTAKGSEYRDVTAFCTKDCEKSFQRAERLARKQAMRPSTASKRTGGPGEDVFETEVVDALAGLGL